MKLKEIVWYLKRPNLYPHFRKEFMRKLLGRKHSPLNQTKAEGTAWCEENSVSAAEAMRQLTGEAPSRRFTDEFAERLKTARGVAEACPAKMGGPGDLDMLYQIAEHLQADKVLETGVAYGWSSLALLSSLSNRPAARLVSNDMPYLLRDNDEYVGCVVPDALRDQWTLLRYADRQGVPKALDELGSLDLCHYDSDKGYEGRLWAYDLIWNRLRDGGYLISDDIGDNVAFRDYCQQIGKQPVIFFSGNKYVGVLIKG